MRRLAGMAAVLAVAAALTGNAMAPAAVTQSCSLHFAGSGSKDIAPFSTRSATLTWKAGGHYFFLANRLNNGPSINVVSEALHGTTYMPAGRYQLAIGAVASWTICIR